MRVSLTLFFLLSCFVCQGARAEVRIEGVSASLEANIRAHMRLDDEPCDQDPAKVRYRYSRTSNDIRAALRPYGYYDVEVESTLDQTGSGCWKATFQVSPGEPVLIGSLRIDVEGEGADLQAFQTLLEKADLHQGEQLNHAAYETTKNQLLVTAREYGFFEAELVARKLEVDQALRRANIELVLATGPRYRFGELEIIGDILEERLLLRYVDFELDAPFEQRRLRKLHNDLVRGDFFSTVDVRTRLREDDHVADVILTLEEGRRVRYGVGVGFGTDTGLVVRGDIVNRRVNRKGHRLEVDAEVSTVRQNTTVDYRMPGKRPQNDWYSIYGGLNREDTDAVESISMKMGVRENRFHTLHWSSTPFTEFVVERFRQDGEWSEKVSLVPGWGIKYLDANAPDRPTRGARFRTEVAGASRQIVSDASFLRVLVDGKVILPVTKKGRLLFRGEAGWMTTNDFDRVPPTWRFFAGGDRSVRGYDYQSLGPVDADGKSIGGQRLLTGSVEADWRVRERWSGAVFADAGNVGEADLLKELPWSVGLGVRWYSPVGPIRLDLAFPQTGTSSFRVHISMGPDL